MEALNKQLGKWEKQFQNEVKIKKEDIPILATAFSNEIKNLSEDIRQEIREATPVDIHLRYEELRAFQSYMDITHNRTLHPSEARAQIINTNYICFVYLNESCFRIIKQHLTAGSTTKKCCNYLVNNPIRAFRNAIAHSNWSYKDDFSAILYWARKSSDQNEPLEQFEVTNEQLGFWQTLARGLAYVIYEEIV